MPASRDGRLSAFLSLLLSLSLFISCADSGPALAGTWEGDGMVLEVREDHTAVWTLDTPGGRESFAVAWSHDASVEPQRFDVSGFERGPLAGQTLYGIVELTGPDTLRWDAAPGPAGAADAEAVRPTTFSPEDTRTLHRVVSQE
jgi:hypothetical protein